MNGRNFTTYLNVSFALMVPNWGYKLWHYRAYKEENKNRLIEWSLVIAVAILFLLFGASASAQNISGPWNGVLNIGAAKLKIVFNLKADGTCTLDSPDQGAKDLPATVVFVSEDSLNVTSPALGMTYAGRLKNGVIQGVFSQNMYKTPLELKPGTVELRRPQTPRPPYPYATEEVTFTNDKAGATLAGTLTLPDGASKALLMVTGSGQQNRDEEIFGHKPFAVIADYLARHGIATLRNDDRCFGQSTGGDVKNATTRDLADDAAAGIDWLRQSGCFRQVGILGHSEGATIAFMLGAEGKVDFIVSMAGPAVRGDSILLFQNRMLGGEAARDLTMEQMMQLPAIRQALDASPWYRYFITEYDPQPDIRRITCPVLALNGSLDMQVSATQNLSALRRTLRQHPQTQFHEYPGLNHLFQHCQTGLPTEYNQIEETISEQVLTDISNWLQYPGWSRSRSSKKRYSFSCSR